jgi:hypothetical protein
LAAGAAYAGGCNTASYSGETPCSGSACTCEQDPEQPLCKAFNDRDDASLTEPFDAAPQAPTEAGRGDASVDAADDAADAA